MELDPPILLCDGRYRLVRTLGEGGMATVYRAVDTRLKVERAIKLLSPELAKSPKLRQRFEEEAQTMARLHHPHIVTVHDVGTDGERAFIVMEVVSGGNLMDRVQRDGVYSVHGAVTIGCQVLAALEHAHRNGVIHRDMKPHNVLLDGGTNAKVTDFGIARLHGREQALTMTGARMGTLEYMSPEILSDATQASPQSDVYAVAGTILAILTGRNPPALYADNLHARLLGRLPEALAQVIVKAGRYDPEDRYPSAEAMAAALREAGEQLKTEEIPRARPPGGPALEIDSGGGAVAQPAPAASIGGHTVSGPTLEPPATLAPAPLTTSGTFASEDPLASFTTEAAPRRWPWIVAAGAVVAVVAGAWAMREPETPAVAPVAVSAPARPPPAEPEAAPEPEPPPPPEPTPTPTPAARPVAVVPPKPAPKAEAKPAAALVTVAINSVPAGSVRIDGGASIDLPARGLSVPEGRHKLVFTDADGRTGTLTPGFTVGGDNSVCWDFDAGAACSR